MLAGKPRQGDIAIKKRVSRLKFHYAIRYVTKENIRLRNIKMGEAVAGNDDRSLWEEHYSYLVCMACISNSIHP